MSLPGKIKAEIARTRHTIELYEATDGQSGWINIPPDDTVYGGTAFTCGRDLLGRVYPDDKKVTVSRDGHKNILYVHSPSPHPSTTSRLTALDDWKAHRLSGAVNVPGGDVYQVINLLELLATGTCLVSNEWVLKFEADISLASEDIEGIMAYIASMRNRGFGESMVDSEKAPITIQFAWELLRVMTTSNRSGYSFWIDQCGTDGELLRLNLSLMSSGTGPATLQTLHSQAATYIANLTPDGNYRQTATHPHIHHDIRDFLHGYQAGYVLNTLEDIVCKKLLDYVEWQWVFNAALFDRFAILGDNLLGVPTLSDQGMLIYSYEQRIHDTVFTGEGIVVKPDYQYEPGAMDKMCERDSRQRPSGNGMGKRNTPYELRYIG